LSEWGDVGQITAAALTAKYHRPLVVWLGAVGAMVTKGALRRFWAGASQMDRDRIAPSGRALRRSSLLLVLGALSVPQLFSKLDFRRERS